MEEDRRIELRISSALLDEVDAARGTLARAAWVKKAMRIALAAEGQAPALSRPASSRALEGHVQVPMQLKDRYVYSGEPQRAPGVVRASGLAKRDVKPRPKRGEK